LNGINTHTHTETRIDNIYIKERSRDDQI